MHYVTDLFMYVRTILRWTRKNAVYDSDTPVTLKQDQGHQTRYEFEDPKQGFNNAKFEKPGVNGAHERSNGL